MCLLHHQNLLDLVRAVLPNCRMASLFAVCTAYCWTMCAYWMQQTGRGSVSKAQKKSAPSFTGCSLCASHSPLLDLLLKLECDVAYGCAEAACWTKAACASRSISSTRTFSPILGAAASWTRGGLPQKLWTTYLLTLLDASPFNCWTSAPGSVKSSLCWACCWKMKKHVGP
ncbi:hypothetical protein VIGAN_UM073400 [Vigna angularis var. angularis]|uniref:Uncharacterized protein n=1 Tax=Vigna angularis var. angularis TaxID=157739 RepID=A0A0S3TEB0_PHAAN|nr:hypothetical protein VIGAN_UM073400 [Vigna angularis var. angularis]